MLSSSFFFNIYSQNVSSWLLSPHFSQLKVKFLPLLLPRMHSQGGTSHAPRSQCRRRWWVSAGCHTHRKGSKIMAHGLVWCTSLFQPVYLLPQRKRLSLHPARTSSAFVSSELLNPIGLCRSFPPLKAKKQLLTEQSHRITYPLSPA